MLPEISRAYRLGLLNSSLLEWVIRQTATTMRGGYFSYESRFIRSLPIRTIDFTDPADVARHDRMVAPGRAHAGSAQEARGRGRTPHVKTVLQRQIEATDRQIDRLVYELYGLTDEEIAVVEGATRN